MAKNGLFGVEYQMAKYLRNTTWMTIMVALNESTAILDLFYAINGLQKKIMTDSRSFFKGQKL